MSEEIRTLLARYSDAVCRFDADQWAATWATDAVWEMGPMTKSGRDEIATSWKGMLARLDGVIHAYLNGWVDLDEEAGTGTGRWYVIEHFKRLGEGPMTMYGYYDDEYCQEEGEWKFARRALHRIYYGPPDMSGDFTGFGLQ
ncbi:nuclear transport factor 2 family protein [Candidatus Poriferisocius sp.]|uniref:nuclear transport factor 2 family protein n=1 Tax=Candidatus Poriferisocius sp. TaxID=3101276 RepID=UPI003B5B227B